MSTTHERARRLRHRDEHALPEPAPAQSASGIRAWLDRNRFPLIAAVVVVGILGGTVAAWTTTRSSTTAARRYLHQHGIELPGRAWPACPPTARPAARGTAGRRRCTRPSATPLGAPAATAPAAPGRRSASSRPAPTSPASSSRPGPSTTAPGRFGLAARTTPG